MPAWREQCQPVRLGDRREVEGVTAVTEDPAHMCASGGPDTPHSSVSAQYTNTHTQTYTQVDIQTHTQRYSQTQIHTTDTQRDIHTHRHTQTDRHRHTYIQTHRHTCTDIQIDKHTDTHRNKASQPARYRLNRHTQR